MEGGGLRFSSECNDAVFLVPCAPFWDWGVGCRVYAAGCRVQGVECKVQGLAASATMLCFLCPVPDPLLGWRYSLEFRQKPAPYVHFWAVLCHYAQCHIHCVSLHHISDKHVSLLLRDRYQHTHTCMCACMCVCVCVRARARLRSLTSE